MRRLIKGWHKIVVPDGDTGKALASEIIETFKRIFTDAGVPRDAALFETKSSVHPRLLYFTPGAELIFGQPLNAFSAVACECPARESVMAIHAQGGMSQFFM
jgi:hypothetical protein